MPLSSADGPAADGPAADGCAAQRTGVILAAGFGARLRGAGRATALKPLTPVAGTPLIVRTLRTLERAGCHRAVVVLGYEHAAHRAGIEEVYDGPLALRFVVNEQYDLQNGLSALAARPFVEGPFVLTMADHVVGDEVAEVARHHTPFPGHAALLVDYKLGAIFDMDDATKVRTGDGRVQAIGKDLARFNAVDTGLFVGTGGLMDALEAVYRQQGDASLTEGVRRLAAAGRMQALDIGAGFWQDVDTPAMRAHAAACLEARARRTAGS